MLQQAGLLLLLLEQQQLAEAAAGLPGRAVGAGKEHAAAARAAGHQAKGRQAAPLRLPGRLLRHRAAAGRRAPAPELLLLLLLRRRRRPAGRPRQLAPAPRLRPEPLRRAALLRGSGAPAELGRRQSGLEGAELPGRVGEEADRARAAAAVLADLCPEALWVEPVGWGPEGGDVRGAGNGFETGHYQHPAPAGRPSRRPLSHQYSYRLCAFMHTSPSGQGMRRLAYAQAMDLRGGGGGGGEGGVVRC